jgi:sugar lactone lactonase YvrE
MLRKSWLRLAFSRPGLGSRRQAIGPKKRLQLRLEPLETRELLSATITTVAGAGLDGFSGDGGPAINAFLAEPSGVAVDSKGNLFIVDDFNERIRQVAPTGVISTFAGNGTVGDTGDGGPATNAEFQLGDGGGVGVDGKGDVLIADPDKSRVREVTPAGTIIPFAGSFDNQGNSGDGGQAVNADLNTPFAVAVDSKGDVFIADSGNNNIREVNTAGIISTVAGNGTEGFGGDGGPATSAELNMPSDVAVDAKGDLFILDSGNNRVREVTPSGTISTIAGNGTAGFSGDGGLASKAQLNFTLEGGVAVDANGNIIIADSGNNRIREVSSAGIITTVAGNGTAGFSGDNGPGTSAELNNPTGVAVDAKGNLFIGDTFNNRIREVFTGSGSATQLVDVLGLDNQVYAQKIDSNGSSASAYYLAAPGQVLGFRAGHTASGQPELFGVGLDGQLYTAQFDSAGNPTVGYHLVAPGQINSFTLGYDASNDPEVFALGKDSQVYSVRFNSSGQPVTGYTLTHGGQVKSIVVGQDGSKNPELFALGQDNQVYSQKFNASGTSVSGYALTRPGQVQSLGAGSDASGNPELFALGLDNQVYGQKFNANGNSASAYFLTTGGKVQSFVVSHDASGDPELFAVGQDGQVYSEHFNASGTSTSTYALTRPGQVKALSATSDASNDPELFVIGLDNQVYGQKFDSRGNSASNYFFTQPGLVKGLRTTG